MPLLGVGASRLQRGAEPLAYPSREPFQCADCWGNPLWLPR
jgi:hypothetical protein